MIHIIFIELDLEPVESGTKIDSFSRGHITIRGFHGIATSKETKPSQSMMIFFSALELLDGVRRFIKDRQRVSYNYVGADSSFQFFLKKNGDLMAILNADKEQIASGTQLEIVQAIWQGVSNFMSSFGKHLNSADLVVDDLHSSIKEFKEQFKLDD